MAWPISYTSTAKKQLRQLDRQIARRILDYMDDWVANDPRTSGKALKSELGELWRYRIGNTRVLCHIQDDQLIISVVKLGHRKEVSKL